MPGSFIQTACMYIYSFLRTAEHLVPAAYTTLTLMSHGKKKWLGYIKKV